MYFQLQIIKCRLIKSSGSILARVQKGCTFVKLAVKCKSINPIWEHTLNPNITRPAMLATAAAGSSNSATPVGSTKKPVCSSWLTSDWLQILRLLRRPKSARILRNWTGSPGGVVNVWVFSPPPPILECMWKTSITLLDTPAHFVTNITNLALCIAGTWNSVPSDTIKITTNFPDLADPKAIITSYIEKVHSGYWLCRACQTDFSCSGNARAHVESKHYTPGYTCPQCTKYFKIRNNFTQHVKKCVALDLSKK